MLSAARPLRQRRWRGHRLNGHLTFQLAAAICRPMPRRILYALAGRLVMPLAAACLGEARRAVESNLSVLFPGSEARKLRRLALETFRQFGIGFVDLLKVSEGEGSLASVTARLEEPGRSRELRSIGAEHGAILVSPHLGNWELGAAALSAEGLNVSLVALAEQDPGVDEYRRAARRRAGVETIPVGTSFDSFLRVRRALAEGRMVAMLCDRNFDEDRCSVELLGHAAEFLKTPALLSAVSRAPMLPVAFVRLPDGRYRILTGEPVQVGLDGSEQDLARSMNQVASSFGSFIGSFPTQWYNFYPYWPENRLLSPRP